MTSVCNSALQLFAGIPDLADLTGAVAAIELATSLRGPGDCASTSWCRIISACAKGYICVETRLINDVPHSVVCAVAPPCRVLSRNRAVAAVRYLLRCGITMSWRAGAGGAPVRGLSRVPSGESLYDPSLFQMSCLGIHVRRDASLSDLTPLGPGGVRCAVAAFTDGSYKPHTGQCGGGVVLCLRHALVSGFIPGDGNTVNAAAPAPSAGCSWAGELTGVLIALLSVPVDVDLYFAVDSAGEPPVLECDIVSFGMLLRTGNHALVVTIRTLISLRARYGAVTKFRWIPAHTGGDDLDSVMNAVADVLADRGASMGPAPPFLVNEEDAVFWLFGEGAFVSREPFCDVFTHVAGNLSKLLRAGMRDRAMADWQLKPSQGLVAAASPPSLKRLICLVLRTEEPVLHMFLMLFSTRQSPTSDRVCFEQHKTGPALKCWLCPARQSALHIYCCRHACCDGGSCCRCTSGYRAAR